MFLRFANRVVDEREAQPPPLPQITAADLAPYMLPDPDKQKKLG